MSAQYEGVKWGDPDFGTAGGTVTYAFAGPGDPTDYSYDAELNSAYQQEIAYCLAEWSSYADIEFALTTDVANADIVFGWDRIDGTNGTLAQTSYTYTRSGSMVEAEIRFDSSELWSVTNATTNGSEISFEAVALHEIGHALGLDHATDTNSVMYAYYGSSLDLTSEDIGAIETIYGVQQPAFANYHSGWGWASDVGGWNYGWHTTGWWTVGWHQETGWDYGWYMAGSFGWEVGWYTHDGWEFGWYSTGWWSNGWYYDYGGWGIGWNHGAATGGVYGTEDGGWWAPVSVSLASGYGWSYDLGGWNIGWHTAGWWQVGWHYESGWEYGWYDTGTGWLQGWYTHTGWEYGWYQSGAWSYGWFYDYGGWGMGWNQEQVHAGYVEVQAGW